MLEKTSKQKDAIISDQEETEDLQFDLTLRPKTLKEYIGQEKTKEQLRIFLGAAQKRNEPIEHVLVYGPPGLGKTTLAHVLANELGASIKVTSGPAIERAGDLASLLTNLQDFDILFIDEVHRLSHVVEEVLYPAMEDYKFDIILGKGPGARSVRLELPRFTIIGATTRIGSVSAPLRDRFGVTMKLGYYKTAEIEQIVDRSSKILGIEIDKAGVSEISARARQTPRIANRLLRRVRDYAQVKADGKIVKNLARQALELLEIDHLGLNKNDREILATLINKFDGGPVGINTLATATNEEEETITDIYEPYLMQLGFLERTPKGRKATRLAYAHLGLTHDKSELAPLL